MNKPEIIIILDAHPIEDGRIQKHIQFLLKEKYTVVHIHITPYSIPEPLPEGYYSIFGEKSYNINLNWKITTKYFRLLNYLSLFSPSLVTRVIKALNENSVEANIHGIIHVHDPILLPLAKKLQETMLNNSKIVYDRHEIYERMKRFGGVGGYKLFEKISKNSISGVVVVSDGLKDNICIMFPGAIVHSVPNFPMISLIQEEKNAEKIKNFSNSSNIHCVYIGSLQRNLDRDIDLLLKIVGKILTKIPDSRFSIGGPCNDNDLLARFMALQKTFPNRFTYLGIVPYSNVIEITQSAHIGFFFIKPDTSYWVPCSPNKVFEYLSCGVIPVVRAQCDYRDEMTSCGLFFDRNTTESTISDSLISLLNNPEEMKKRMRKCLEIGATFSYETVAPNYLTLYDLVT